jgi:hypothetical protein
MDDVTASLVAGVLELQAEVAALRIISNASVVDDPLRYIRMAAAQIDDFSLHLVMSDGQREVMRSRLEHTRELWLAHMREAHPGGWLGLRYGLARTVRSICSLFSGWPHSRPK